MPQPRNTRTPKSELTTSASTDMKSRVPAEYGTLPGYGDFDGKWYTEFEPQGASRFSYRIEQRLHEEVSGYQKITVYQTRFFGRLLTLDDLVMFSERDEFVYHEMLTHVPLCALSQPKTVLIIGGGDCGCLREALRHSSIERVVQCEIDERVTRVCAEYFPWVREAIHDPRVELVFGDGVKLIDDHERAFDLVVVDSTDPVGPAAGLFLRDFYRKVARSLRPGGVMTAQTESPHWSAPMVGAICNEIRRGFRDVALYLGYVPTYPSGCWSWAYATNSGRSPTDLNEKRAAQLAVASRYYNADIHRAAFALPNFAQHALKGRDPFGRFGG